MNLTGGYDFKHTPPHYVAADMQRYAGKHVDQKPPQHAQHLEPAVQANVRYHPVGIRRVRDNRLEAGRMRGEDV